MSRRSDVAELRRRLASQSIALSTAAAERMAASRDFSWLSPVLTAKLPSRPADLVASPRHLEELIACVTQAAACSVPITLRGLGTGNYGQSVPLSGGLLIDTQYLNDVLEVGEGRARVAPGVACQDLECAARQYGQELSLFPSTTASTLGGFVAGGAGGSGSIRHGFVWEGFVLGMKVLAATSDATPISLDCGPVHLEKRQPVPIRSLLHSYGTVGVIAELEVSLDPAHIWVGLAASFRAMEEATEAAHALLHLGLEARLLGVSESSLVGAFPPMSWLDPGRVSLRAVVDKVCLDDACAKVVAARGRVDALGEALVRPITQLSYNHVTLRAKLADPSICHLQVGGLDDPKHRAIVRRCLPEARMHLDAMRGPNGPAFGGLVMSRFVDAHHLTTAIGTLRDAGMHVVDPHTWAVADPDGIAGRAAAVLDPAGLLNPGKLARPAPDVAEILAHAG